MRKLNSIGSSTGPWGTSLATDLQLNNHPLGGTIQPAFNPSHCLFVQPKLHQLVDEDLTGGSVRSLTKVKVKNTQCSLLILQVTSL